MDNQQYLLLADRCLHAVENWLEEFDPDEVDFSSADGVLKIEFPDGQTFVLNRQAGNHQMWFAAVTRAWHYDRKGEAWVDDRDGHTLETNIASQIGEKLGRKLALDPV